MTAAATKKQGGPNASLTKPTWCIVRSEHSAGEGLRRIAGELVEIQQGCVELETRCSRLYAATAEQCKAAVVCGVCGRHFLPGALKAHEKQAHAEAKPEDGVKQSRAEFVSRRKLLIEYHRATGELRALTLEIEDLRERWDAEEADCDRGRVSPSDREARVGWFRVTMLSKEAALLVHTRKLEGRNGRGGLRAVLGLEA